MYVTTDERSAAEDIHNTTKEEILRREDFFQLLSDKEIKADLLKELADFPKQISTIKKGHIVSFLRRNCRGK